MGRWGPIRFFFYFVGDNGAYCPNLPSADGGGHGGVFLAPLWLTSDSVRKTVRWTPPVCGTKMRTQYRVSFLFAFLPSISPAHLPKQPGKPTLPCCLHPCSSQVPADALSPPTSSLLARSPSREVKEERPEAVLHSSAPALAW